MDVVILVVEAIVEQWLDIALSTSGLLLVLSGLVKAWNVLEDLWSR